MNYIVWFHTNIVWKRRRYESPCCWAGAGNDPQRAEEEAWNLAPGTVLDFNEQNGKLIAVKTVSADPVEQVYGCLKTKVPTDTWMERLRGKSWLLVLTRIFSLISLEQTPLLAGNQPLYWSVVVKKERWLLVKWFGLKRPLFFQTIKPFLKPCKP